MTLELSSQGSMEFLSYGADFAPELIVEVTTVCDRSCDGCYAQNFLRKDSKQELFRKYPQFFLSCDQFTRGLEDLPRNPGSLAVRGGEPSRHPLLHELIQVIYEAGISKIYLETHGRWIVGNQARQLIKTMQNTKTIMKISYDSMHELPEEQLKKTTAYLDEMGIEYLIAITEKDSASFVESRSRCSWVEDKRIIFQPKAFGESALIEPELGIMDCNGIIKNTLNTRKSFRRGNAIH